MTKNKNNFNKVSCLEGKNEKTILFGKKIQNDHYQTIIFILMVS